MMYILRTTTGTVLSDEVGEKTFHSKDEAENFLSLLKYSTTDNWKLIPLENKENKEVDLKQKE